MPTCMIVLAVFGLDPDRLDCRSQEAALTGQIDAANAELAQAQQAAQMKGQDLQQLERRRDNLHQQVGGQVFAACAVLFWQHSSA